MTNPSLTGVEMTNPPVVDQNPIAPVQTPHSVTLTIFAETEEKAREMLESISANMGAIGQHIAHFEDSMKNCGMALFKVKKTPAVDVASLRTSGVANHDVTSPGGVPGLNGADPAAGNPARPGSA